MVDSLVERARRAGLGAASPIDLLAIGFSRREEDASRAEDMGRDLLRRLERIERVGELAPDTIREVTGLDGFEIIRCQALIELGRRAGSARKGVDLSGSSASEIAERLTHLRREKKEHFCAVLLDAKNQIIRIATIHIGTLTYSVVGPREVFGEALREGASAIVIVHNHPSGDPTPSPEDLDVTDRLLKIGEMLDIPVLDHVIIGAHGYVSLRERGALR